MTLSTMDIPFSPEMGGKEGLSALGWSRVRRMGTPLGSPDYPPELWAKSKFEGPRVAISTNGACFFDQRTIDEDAQWASADEMRAVLKRIEELKAGDTE